MSLNRSDSQSIGHNGRHENLAPLSVKVLEKIGLFKKADNLVLYKKSERICAATFVISDGIASEGLRERVQEEALNVFSGVRDAIARRGSILPADADRLALAAVSLASVLELACRIGEIAESNYTLMRQECVRLAEALVDAAARSNDAFDPRILDSGIKDVALPAVAPAKQPDARVAREPRLPVNRQSFIGHVKDTKEEEKPQVSFKGSLKDLMANIGSSIEDRESKIMEVVRMKGKVSIKDISESMPGVGEKTVQRALTSLVTRGVLKKEGERRWSRYALAQATLAV